MVLRRCALWLLVVSACATLFAGNPPTPTTDTDFAARARTALQEARARYQVDPRDGTNAWQFAHACFDVAEFATNSAERAAIAQQGIAACRQVLGRESNSAPAHYYLGMNLGQLARTRGLGALKLVTQMQSEFSRARDLDQGFDHGGPDRCLGLLYRDAPAVASIGSRTKARRHLRRAADLAPDFPENRLNLIETYLQWNDRNGARRELKALEEAWPDARTSLTGAAWAASWADWEQRLRTVEKKAEEPSRALEAPSQKH